MSTTTRILFIASAATALSCASTHAGVRQPIPPSRTPVSAPSSVEGPYIRIEPGISFISNADAKLDLGGIAGFNGRMKFKPGFVYGGAIGYRFNELALEGELDSTHNTVKSGPADLGRGQSLRQTSLLGNILWSPKINDITLWLGGGLGAQFQNNNFGTDTTTASNVLIAGDSLTVSGQRKSDTAFLGQVKMGVSVPIAQNWSFDAGYKLRFVSQTDVAQVDQSYKSAPAAAAVNSSAKVRLDGHLNHLLTAGFSYQF